jgi:hypothetical protein
LVLGFDVRGLGSGEPPELREGEGVETQGLGGNIMGPLRTLASVVFATLLVGLAVDDSDARGRRRRPPLHLGPGLSSGGAANGPPGGC